MCTHVLHLYAHAPAPSSPPPTTHTHMYAQTQHVCVFRKCYIVLLLVIFSPVGHKRVSHKDPFQPHRRVHSLDAGTAQHDLFSHWPEGNKQRWPTNCRPLCLSSLGWRRPLWIFFWSVFVRWSVCVVLYTYVYLHAGVCFRDSLFA